MEATDVAIVGAGAAGLSTAAAIAGAGAGLRVLVLERMGAGGQVMTVENIRNFPGHPQGISGFELGPLLQEQAEEAGAEFLLDTVLRLEGGDGDFVLHCEGTQVHARAVLVAAGSARRKLQVPGEEALEARGVSHCASCDGPLFRGAAVCVVGGGDSAFGEAQVLAGHAEQVTIVFREPQPIAQPELVAAVAPLPNVRLLPGLEVVAIEGSNAVTGVRVRAADGSESEIQAEGVFVYAGLQAAGEFLGERCARDADGRIRTDAAFHTSCRGVFAAGDIRAGAAWLLATAAEEGRAAGGAVVRHLVDATATLEADR
jgi:thioredoxin reductase (NADPH)